jgi:hypothetical protein
MSSNIILQKSDKRKYQNKCLQHLEVTYENMLNLEVVVNRRTGDPRELQHRDEGNGLSP